MHCRSGVYFGSYEYLKRLFRGPDGTIPVAFMLLSGGTAGISSTPPTDPRHELSLFLFMI